jgi:protein-tyrosine phosphatase
MKTIYWVDEYDQKARYAIVARPRGGDWLQDDLTELKNKGIDILISFLPTDEEWALGLTEEARIAGELGLEFISYPIPDRAVPGNTAEFRDLVNGLANAVRGGKTVGVHCRGCIGRSTVLIASLMIALGYEARDALRRIESARGFPVPDTPEQREWILRFQP